MSSTIDVVLRRVAPLDVVELLLLVDVDQDVAVDGVEQPRALDLARLEDDVAVREDHRRAPGARMLDDVERLGKEPVGEGIVDEELRDGEHVRVARMLDAVALERAEVVGVAQLGRAAPRRSSSSRCARSAPSSRSMKRIRSATTRSLSSSVLSTSKQRDHRVHRRIIRYPEKMRAVIFDLDGTLVDTVYGHVLAWHKVLEEGGFESRAGRCTGSSA